jgi:hypothetical protein
VLKKKQIRAGPSQKNTYKNPYSLKAVETPPKISWVKSHQDEKLYDEIEMPLDAYLNSEADELVTTGQKRLQEKPIVPANGSRYNHTILCST